MTNKVLYSATTPLAGAVLTKAAVDGANTGAVPYFVSGPLSRDFGYVGLFGTVLHVAAWLVAIIFDCILGATIDQDQSPGAFEYWVWGLTSLLIGFVALVVVTFLHWWMPETRRIPEGGAPPFLMTLFIGGAQISLLLTILQMVASSGAVAGDFFNYPASAGTAAEQKDYRNAQRNLMVVTLVAKVYIVNFLKNNQDWAGPAAALKG